MIVYFNRKPIWKFLHDSVFIPVQVFLEITFNPFNWLSGSINKKIEERIGELRYD